MVLFVVVAFDTARAVLLQVIFAGLLDLLVYDLLFDYG